MAAILSRGRRVNLFVSALSIYMMYSLNKKNSTQWSNKHVFGIGYAFLIDKGFFITKIQKHINPHIQ